MKVSIEHKMEDDTLLVELDGLLSGDTAIFCLDAQEARTLSTLLDAAGDLYDHRLVANVMENDDLDPDVTTEPGGDK